MLLTLQSLVRLEFFAHLLLVLTEAAASVSFVSDLTSLTLSLVSDFTISVLIVFNYAN